MSRAACGMVLAASVVCGCQLPPERIPLRPLPENMQPVPYAELLTRARLQATAATEAFYVSRWADVQDAAGGLEQTGRFLARAIEIPPRHQTTLAQESAALVSEANKLREAATAQDAKRTNEALQRLNLRVRELRPEP